MYLVSAGLSSLAMSWFPALMCALLVGGSLGRFVPVSPHDWELSKSSPVKYIITGQKDIDGHWTEQVKMEHGEEDWHMEVDHMTLDVGEGQPKVKITATFSAKSKPNDVAVVPDESSQSGESGATESGGNVPGTVFQLFPRSYMDWFEAQVHCMEWGGHLAIPDTRDKMRQLTALLRKHVQDIGESTGAFLGFNDLKQEGHFVTVLGEPLFNPQGSSWTPHWFQAGQPDDDKAWSDEGEDCGSMRPNGGLNDVPCRYNLPYICEKAEDDKKAVDEEEASSSVADGEDEVVEKEASSSVAEGEDEVVEEEASSSVAEGEDEVDDTLHLFRYERVNWFQARLACVQRGGHLAIPDSEAKMLKMKTMLQEGTSPEEHVSAFVGFNDIKKEGHFVTIFGEPVFDDGASWNPHWFNAAQPDDDKSWTTYGEDCGSVRPEGGLNDVPCSYMLPYFCEKSSRVDDVTPSASGNDGSVKSNGVPCSIHTPLLCDHQSLLPLTSDEELQDSEYSDYPEESSTEEELTLVINNIASTDLPTAVHTNEEGNELTSSSTEETLLQVVTSFRDLDAPSDSPLGVQTSQEDESSSSMGGELWEEDNTYHPELIHT